MDDRTEIANGEEDSFVNPLANSDRTRLTVPLVTNRPVEPVTCTGGGPQAYLFGRGGRQAPVWVA